MSNQKNAQIPVFSRSSGKIATRLYIITSGEYDDYRIETLVSGPARFDKAKLMRKFEKMCNWPDQHSAMSGDDYYDAYQAAIKHLEANGYEGNTKEEYFLDWLLKTDDRFQRVDYQEVGI